jgi:hypothetical protein
MSRTRAGDLRGASPWRIDRKPFESPAGLKILIPGLPQLSWNQRERGIVFAGSFVFALLVWLWTWGTWLSFAILTLAYITHVASTMDALRQTSFPAFRRAKAVFLTSGALGLMMYVPVHCTLFVVAWPGFSSDATQSGYLVNCWAYRHAEPLQGDWIWLRLPSTGLPHAGEVVAVSGQEVEWTGSKWQVDGHECILKYFPNLTAWPQVCRFQVPKNQVLVEPQDNGGVTAASASLVLVSSDRIIGRAWAKFYPVRDRHLL